MTNITGVQRLCSFIPYFESLDPGKAYQVKGGEKKENGVITMPYYVYDEKVQEFMKAVYESGLMVSDYVSELNSRVPDWQTVDIHKVVETADLELVKVILTKCIRVERFNEGALAQSIDNGLILAILRRLQGLTGE